MRQNAEFGGHKDAPWGFAFLRAVELGLTFAFDRVLAFFVPRLERRLIAVIVGLFFLILVPTRFPRGAPSTPSPFPWHFVSPKLCKMRGR